MDVIIPTNLVLILFDPAIPSSSFNFIQFHSIVFILISVLFYLVTSFSVAICMK